MEHLTKLLRDSYDLQENEPEKSAYWHLQQLRSEIKQLALHGVVSSKKPYYMLVNKNGNPITTDSKLPIFWLKKIAKKEAVKFKADIKKIYL